MAFPATIRRIYDALIQEVDLAPSPKINELFSTLVREVILTVDETPVLTTREVSNLQKMCSRAEYELEVHWAKRILAAKNPDKELSLFPYFKNYHDLTRLEWFSFQGCQNHKNHRILFCGGGPLPLTAIMLARLFAMPSIVIDGDEQAVQLSQSLIRRLGLSPLITIKKADAQQFAAYNIFSVIFVAALAGLMPDEKNKIFGRIKERARKNTHIIARSSWGNRKLLYRPLPKETYQHFQPILQVDPFTDIVNSVVILKKV